MRLVLVLLLSALTKIPALASIMPAYHPQTNTWNATHIVVVESGRVVESWKGDLKSGETLPESVVRFTQVVPPRLDPSRLKAGEKRPTVSGKRMVLFLAYVAQEGQHPTKLVWTNADAPGHLPNNVLETTVAWVEGDDVYSVSLPDEGTSLSSYVLHRDGTIAGLKQRVDLGLALRAQFEAAKADKDPKKRAERLVILTPFISKYARYYGRSECIDEVSKCGAPAGKYLADWALDPSAEYASESLSGLARLGDAGFDGMLSVIDAEVGYWRSVAKRLRPDISVDQIAHTNPIDRWRGPSRLRSILEATRRMTLSEKNKDRLSEHAGLRELDKFLDQPAMKSENADMMEARNILKDILAGKIGARE